MPYQYLTKTYADQPARPNFEVNGRVNMTHFFMKLDHRIPWLTLRNALNRVLNGTVDSKLVNYLMMLSPARDPQIMKRFTVAVNECKAEVNPKRYFIDAFEYIEKEIFSLPVNLALGCNNRADDPGGDSMDFTPDDIDWTGQPITELQRLRENLFGALSVENIDAKSVLLICRDIVGIVGTANLNVATAANLNNWHPGPLPQLNPPQPLPQRTQPPYRYWVKIGGDIMNVNEINALTKIVTRRALRL